VSVALPQVGQHWGVLAVGLTHEGLEGIQGHNPGTDLGGLQCRRKESQQPEKATSAAHPSVHGMELEPIVNSCARVHCTSAWSSTSCWTDQHDAHPAAAPPTQFLPLKGPRGAISHF
jgi:hypothetical protein